jgi:hypothetical protein
MSSFISLIHANENCELRKKHLKHPESDTNQTFCIVGESLQIFHHEK